MEEAGEQKKNAAEAAEAAAESEPKRRVFFALSPDPTTQKFLEHERRVLLSKAWGKRGRFVEIEDYHLTLHFCGDQSKEVIEKLLALGEKIASETSSPTLPVASATLFPRASRARALVSLATNSPELKALARQLVTDCADYGIDEPRHAFRPHFTLARLKKNNALPNLKTPKERTATFCADGLVLYATQVGTSGLCYEKLGHFPFKQRQEAPASV